MSYFGFENTFNIPSKNTGRTENSSWFSMPSFSTNTSYSPASSAKESASSILGYAYIVAVTLFVGFIILIIVHYAFTPIFSFSTGDGGIIPLGVGNQDYQITFTKEPAGAALKSDFTNILSCGYTLQMDLYINRNLQLSEMERVITYRGSKPVGTGLVKGRSLPLNYPESNLLVYLQKDTNDLIVSAVTKINDLEALESAPTVLNAPLRQPFRLTIVYMPQLLEVYINGRFRGSRVLKGQPKNTPNQFFGPPDPFQQTVKMVNLCYWNRPLLAREIVNAPPALADSSLFKPDDEASCAT
jgi:hypothetical protein